MSDIPEAKRRLPLPELMKREGLGERAKKSARCPFHDDQRNSFSVWQTDSAAWCFKCHAGCGQGDEIDFLEKHKGISKSEATKLFLKMAEVNGARPAQHCRNEQNNKIGQQSLNWRACVDAFTDRDSLRLAIRRGYDRDFRSWLKQTGLIGKYKNYFAFPVHDPTGNIVAVHYGLDDGSWGYHPQGAKVRPLVIGELVVSKPVHVFESQWDAFAFADLSGERSGIIITRGAGNGKLVGSLIPGGATVYAWKQNDELKNGKRAGDEWLKDVTAHAGANVLWAKTPDRFKDLNEWTRAGATAEELLAAMTNAEMILGGDKNARSPNGEHSYDCGDDQQPRRKSAATQLLEIANTFAFFHDPQDRPFVRLELNSHTEVWPLESSKFRKLLAGLYYKRVHKAINRNALTDAITTLAGRACHDSPEETVFLRVAPHGENILIDLCDTQWRVVEVAPNGWRVLPKSPVAFVRTGSMQALPEPVQGGSIAPLWELLNVTKAQRPLVAGGLLNAFHPRGPYFVLNYVGEQGTAKSCAARINRQLVDPNENPLRSPPKEERDLLAQAASNRCVALDNLSSLPAWLSDALCRLATGGGHSARTLYTDLEEISLAVKRPVILNGIEDVATRPDLAERVLQIELETIPEEKRISETVLWRHFDRQRPVIFSGLLNALVCALHELPNVALASLPRMADAALWATAGETAFGWKRGTFMTAYRQNLDEGAIASVEAHPVGVAIRELLEGQSKWQGEPAQLLQALTGLASEEQRQAKSWPRDPRSLGHSLRRLAPALRGAGITVDRDKGTRRIIRLCKAREKTSETSASPENHAGKDVQDVADDLSPHLHK